MNEKKESIDNSRLSEYQACPQLYDYKYNHELGDESGHAARFSTFMIHKPVQEWWRHGGDYSPNWQELMGKWAPSTEDMLKDKYNNYSASSAKLLFDQYVEQRKDDLEIYRVIEIEVYRTRKIIKGYKPWGSKTDIVLQYIGDGMHIGSELKLHTLEIKASKWDYILTGMNFNRQVLGQIYTCEAEKGLVDFFYLNGKKSQYMRFEIEPNESEMRQWHNDRALEFEQMKLSESHNIWPRNASSCRRFNQVCPFLELCDLGGSGEPLVQQRISEMPKRNSLAYLEE